MASRLVFQQLLEWLRRIYIHRLLGQGRYISKWTHTYICLRSGIKIVTFKSFLILLIFGLITEIGIIKMSQWNNEFSWFLFVILSTLLYKSWTYIQVTCIQKECVLLFLLCVLDLLSFCSGVLSLLTQMPVTLRSILFYNILVTPLS